MQRTIKINVHSNLEPEKDQYKVTLSEDLAFSYADFLRVCCGIPSEALEKATDWVSSNFQCHTVPDKIILFLVIG